MQKTITIGMLFLIAAVASGVEQIDIGADEGVHQRFGMEVLSAENNSGVVTIVTTGATYVLSTTGMDMYRRIDPDTNTVDSSNSGKGREVAELDFSADIGALSIDSSDSDSAIVESTRATFEFQSDSFFFVTAKESFRVKHTNLIANAPWNAPLDVSDRNLDRMWTDGYGGSLLAHISEDTKGSVYAEDLNYTTVALNPNQVTAHMVYPPKTYDFEGLYGENARPHVEFLYVSSERAKFVNDTNNYRQNLIHDGFGVIVLWNTIYDSGDSGPELLTSGLYGYKVSDPDDLNNLISVADAAGFNVITYLRNPGHSTWNGQDIEVTLEWMKAFQQEYGLDGWYFDNSNAGDDLWDDYDFIRQVRTDVGDGIIYHHDSVDVWASNTSGGAYSGLRAIMVDAYVNYTLTGETGMISKVDSPNDPYFRYYSAGYGMSQAYASHKRKSNMKIALSEKEKNRVVAENLNGSQRNRTASWMSHFKPAYDVRRAEYLETGSKFDPDVDWPIDPNTGWFRDLRSGSVNDVESNKFDFTISWTTSELADSQVAYTSNGAWWPPYGPDGTVYDTEIKKDHSITLTNLKSNTYYEFRIRSNNGDPDIPGEVICSYVGSFTTDCLVYNDDTKYDSIQDAIDDENTVDGDVIEVRPGVYYENIDFGGKAITVRSTDPDNWDVVAATIIEAADEDVPCVTFESGEDPNSVLKGFTIRDNSYNSGIHCVISSPSIGNCIIEGNMTGISCSYASPAIGNSIVRDNDMSGISCSASSPTISNCIVGDNDNRGIECDSTSSPEIRNSTIVNNGAYGIECSSPTITNCILWGNDGDLSGCSAAYSCIEDGDDGDGNIDDDPLFVEDDPFYHLDPHSPCIDVGDPNGVYTGQTDIDGKPRVVDIPLKKDGIVDVDMGADEWAALNAGTTPCFDCGDTNGDCDVTIKIDYTTYLDAYNGDYDPCADFNKDGYINISDDLQVLLNHWPSKPVSPHGEGCTCTICNCGSSQ